MVLFLQYLNYNLLIIAMNLNMKNFIQKTSSIFIHAIQAMKTKYSPIIDGIGC